MNSSDISISSIDEVTPALWDKYVESHPNSSLYHMSAWADLITQVFGHKTFYCAALNHLGEITGVLPLVQLKSRLFGNYMVSMPFFNMGGVLADDEQTKSALLDNAIEIAKQQGADHIEFREMASLGGDWQCKQDKVLMHLSLPETPEELFKAIGSKRRAQIKRPDRDNIVILQGGAEYVDDFYDVFARNMRDLGTPVYSRQLFSQIVTAMPENAHIIVIKKDGKTVAGAFLLGYKTCLEIPWASSLREYNRIGVNMRLYWEVLKYAIEQKYKVFDFGRSTIDAGTYRFKKQWGAKPVQCYWHYWVKNNGTMPQLNPDNPRYQLAIKVWQKLPVMLTKIIGPGIVKNLP